MIGTKGPMYAVNISSHSMLLEKNHYNTSKLRILYSLTQLHTLSWLFLVNEWTVSGSDNINGMEILHQNKK